MIDDGPDQGVRRFHLSKEQSLEALAALSRKRRGGPAVFVERSFKKSKPSPEPETPREREESRPVSPADGPALADAGAAAAAQPPTAAQTYKRPGARARIAGKTSLPPSLLNRDQDVNMDELAREMEAFALSQIASNLSRIEADSAKAAARRDNFESSPNKSRFRPKVPAQRWAERHPNHVPQAGGQTKTDGVDAASDHGDSTDDDDYVLETYERVPASRLRDQAVPPHRVGLLVFDNEPERVDFFYGVEDESSDEFPEDEEDENGKSSGLPVPFRNTANAIDQPRTTTRQTTLTRNLTGTMSSTGIRTATLMAATGLGSMTMVASPVMRCRTRILGRTRTGMMVMKGMMNEQGKDGMDRRPGLLCSYLFG